MLRGYTEMIGARNQNSMGENQVHLFSEMR